MPFKFDPQPIPSDYLWQGKYQHLTYKGFIGLANLLATVAAATTVNGADCARCRISGAVNHARHALYACEQRVMSGL